VEPTQHDHVDRSGNSSVMQIEANTHGDNNQRKSHPYNNNQ
jgi:hypothetical protein